MSILEWSGYRSRCQIKRKGKSCISVDTHLTEREMIGQLAVVKVERELDLDKVEGHAQIWKLNQTVLEKEC